MLCEQKVPKPTYRIKRLSRHLPKANGGAKSCMNLVSSPPFGYIATHIVADRLMDFSPQTTSLLEEMEGLSRKPLARRTEVGILLELAQRFHLQHVLDELAFYAKFCSRTYGIMQRIGPQGEGYARLSEEFTTRVATCRTLMASIIRHAPEDVRLSFEESVLALTPTAFTNLLDIFRDISRYKNLQIDRRAKK